MNTMEVFSFPANYIVAFVTGSVGKYPVKLVKVQDFQIYRHPTLILRFDRFENRM